MKRLCDTLHKGHYSLVVYNGEQKHFSNHGIQDLYELYHQESAFLHGAVIADKIVGKAAAAIMISAGVKAINADVISYLALNLLQNAPIKVTYSQAVPYIVNRSQTGWCPLETLCKDCSTAAHCMVAIERFMNPTNNQN